MDANTFNNILSISSVFFAIFSIAYAFYTNNKSNKLKIIIYNDAKVIHHNIALALGKIQENLNSDSKKKIIETAGHVEGICQTLLQDSAKLLCNLDQLTKEQIEKLINEGRLESMYKNIYLHYAHDEKYNIKKQFQSIDIEQ